MISIWFFYWHYHMAIIFQKSHVLSWGAHGGGAPFLLTLHMWPTEKSDFWHHKMRSSGFCPPHRPAPPHCKLQNVCFSWKNELDLQIVGLYRCRAPPWAPPHVIIEKFTFLWKFFPIIIFRKNAYFSTYRPKVLKAISPFNMCTIKGGLFFYSSLSWNHQ